MRQQRLALTLWLWLIAVVLICGAAWLTGAQPERLGGFAIVALMPAITGFILNSRFSARWARYYFLGAWALSATMLAAQTGGASSPTTAVFVLAPAYAMALGGGDSIAWAAALSAFGYVAAALLGVSSSGLGAAPECFALAALLLSAAVMLTARAGLGPDAQEIAEIAHELRTPLNHMVGFADMIERQTLGPAPPRYAEYAGLIAQSGRRLIEMISRRLDYVRAEAGGYELQHDAFDLRTTAHDAVALAQGSGMGKRITIETTTPNAPLMIRADAGAVRQMLDNLLGNAIKFTPDGGRVRLEVRAEADRAVLEVADTGPGISAADRARLMEPFTRGAGVRAEGAGLGLALVRRLAQMHGGDLRLGESSDGGLRARVRLPLRAA